MQYLLLIYQDQTRWAQLPDAQQGQIMQEYRAFIQGIVTSGHFRAGARLQPTSIATTVREKSGKRVITEGPFADTKEQLGGFLLIGCQDFRFGPYIAVDAALERADTGPPPSLVGQRCP